MEVHQNGGCESARANERMVDVFIPSLDMVVEIS